MWGRTPGGQNMSETQRNERVSVTRASEQQPRSPVQPGSGGSALGTALGPALIDLCSGRLGPIEWFRTAWQRGGAATGFSTWQPDSGEPVPVMVKLPVNATEFIWTTRMAASGETSGVRPTPRVFAAGDELGPYEFAWLVLERIPGQPLASHLCREGVEGMLQTTARFYTEAEAHSDPTESVVKPPPAWDELLEQSRRAVHEELVEQPARWSALLDRVSMNLQALIDVWLARPITTWCHGDLHPHNMMSRSAAWVEQEGIACEPVLIDLALVHAGTWVEDALYLERLFWGREDRLSGIEPVEDLHRFREMEGLDEIADWARLADVRRILMASSVPAFLKLEGHPVYVAGALDRLEDAVHRHL